MNLRLSHYFAGFLVLAGSQMLCFYILRSFEVPVGTAAIVTLGLCIVLLGMAGAMLYSYTESLKQLEAEEASSRPHATGTVRRTSTQVTQRPSSDLDISSDYIKPNNRATGSSNLGQIQSETYKTELAKSLEEKKLSFNKLLKETIKELNRFDYGVLKTLEKHSPGSVEGVLVARKVYSALEIRVKAIEAFLAVQPIVDIEKGKSLLLSDLEIPEDKQLTAVFKSPPVPPIKISEVEFQLRVLLKRISNRKSIFRPSEIAETISEVNKKLAEDTDEISEDVTA